MPATPDTSPANVARLLRDGADAEDRVANNESPHFAKQYRATADKTRALADALDQQAAAPTWEERVERAAGALALDSRFPGAEWPAHFSADDQIIFRLRAAAALRAAFPELAPSDD